MASTTPGLNQSNQDIVAILDSENYQPLFSGSNVMSCVVRETSKLTSWPVEDGTQRTDHRVIDPVGIDLPLLLNDNTRNLFEQLHNAFIEGRSLIIQTKVKSYANMMILEMPHDETVDYGESVLVSIRIQEIRVVTPEFGTLPPNRVANKSQASTVKKGNQQTSEADQSKNRRASVAYGIFN